MSFLFAKKKPFDPFYAHSSWKLALKILNLPPPFFERENYDHYA